MEESEEANKRRKAVSTHEKKFSPLFLSDITDPANNLDCTFCARPSSFLLRIVAAKTAMKVFRTIKQYSKALKMLFAQHT